MVLLDSVSKDSVAIEMSGVATINFSLVGTVSLKHLSVKRSFINCVYSYFAATGAICDLFHN